MIESRKRFSENNFDLIRLFASLQVVHFHIISIMGVSVVKSHGVLNEFFGIFPGVPIFFFISGYLISKSWENSPSIKAYLINRVLRIYPALIIAVTLSFFFIHISGYARQVNPTLYEQVLLFIAKCTIFQFYNPDFMRQYGDGVMNGSLWTITVELQFYFMVPAMYLFLKVFRSLSATHFISILILIFIFVNYIFNAYYDNYSGHTVYKLIKVSFLPWFYMFLIGVFFQRNFNFFYGILSGKFIFCLSIYVISAYIFKSQGGGFGNSVNPIMYFILASLVFSAAYTRTNLSKLIIKGNDFSYGLYIYHMPIVNFILFTNVASGYLGAALALMASLALSAISWFLVERNAIKLKPKTIYTSNK